mgnify:CR=1 FL=1
MNVPVPPAAVAPAGTVPPHGPGPGSGGTLANEGPSWVANGANPRPVVLFNVPDLRTMLQHDLGQAWREGLDDYVIDTIAAASGINTLAQGTDTVMDAAIKAAGDVYDDGWHADLQLGRHGAGLTTA